jgi:pantetheine-phosphate adenylyltransferase
MSVIMPGSYDPVTLGHLDVIRRIAEREDEVYVVIFQNPKKAYTFSLEDRARMLMLATEGLDNVIVSYSLGRVVDYMREHNIEKIVKGYRNDDDLLWEREQAEYNLKHGGYETELVRCREGFDKVSSTEVRKRLISGEDLDGLVSPTVEKYIKSLSVN